ncbi:alpha/beta fold hydrolase [Hymenobacter jejuensis]|uniref:Alpha/beta hydrolase n=1 Tax=Hymenobacter jejuensis TaxID=2502781 RepID=A0A5B7ZUA4_9BACT|nr:alpha/beta hydrolase [Hymenobacter jejuensis]QDA58774.1 alpha/beta hydrolase [Hymenobacter jejuensis]
MKKTLLLNRFLFAVAIVLLASYKAMSFQTEEVPMRKVIGSYGLPEHTLTLANSMEVAYVDAGKGPHTLIFIHGLSSYVRAWERTIPELSKSARCIALDLPGYGKSSKGAYPGTMDFYADVVLQLIHQLHLKNVVLVGHSMGGQIALTAALKSPADVRKLVLVSPAGFETFTEPEKQQLRNFYTVSSIEKTPEAQVRMNFKYNFYAMPTDVELWIKERLAMMACDDFKQYAQTVVNSMSGMLDGPVFDRLSQVQQPTLVVFGAEDFLIPNRALHPTLTTAMVAAAGVGKLPHAEQVLLPQAGHFAHYEKAPEFNQKVREFIR